MIESFEKWALDFVQPISPMSHKKNYILVCTDYVTKWVEEKTLFRATEKSIVEFIYEDIFTSFGVPHEIVTKQGTQFTSKLMRELTGKYGIKHCKSSPYHPQTNGQVESKRKVLEAIFFGMLYRQHMLVIGGKYNNDDGLSTSIMCQAGTRSILGRCSRASS
jgi:transposase InsO family protein